MPRFKLLALDMDGTVLTDDKKITNTTKYWLNRAMEAGITVMFTTGRGVQTAESYWLELGLDSPIVLVNGAEIWKRPGELMERHFISREGVRQLHKLAVDNEARYWGYSVESLSNYKNWTDEMFERDWMKFGIRHDHLPTIQRLREIVIGWGAFEVTRSAPVNMEISAPGISKATGLAKVCDYLGIQMSEVMAIGDSHNDLHMIQSVGFE